MLGTVRVTENSDRVTLTRDTLRVTIDNTARICSDAWACVRLIAYFYMILHTVQSRAVKFHSPRDKLLFRHPVHGYSSGEVLLLRVRSVLANCFT